MGEEASNFPSPHYFLTLSESDSNAEDSDGLEAGSGLLREGACIINLCPLRQRHSARNIHACSHPVQGEAYCNCLQLNNSSQVACKCGEEDTDFEWKWDDMSKSAATSLLCDDREVKFNSEYSCGTAAVRGNLPMTTRQYYWEVKMTTPVYGTDMMVGVGTVDANLNKFRYTFGSLLGDDGESWGLSYSGKTQHKGEVQCYSSHFGHGSIIGVHLDMWNGTLSFFKNRQPLGVAYSGLQGKTLFPMVSSTAARSGMKVVRCRSFKSSLQFLCCVKLRESIPKDLSVLEAIEIPPGLKAFLQNNLDWLLRASRRQPVNMHVQQLSNLKRKHYHVNEGGYPDESEPLLKKRCS